MLNMQIDPHKKYTDVGEDRLFAATGLLPQFFIEAVMTGAKGVEGVKESLERSYGFGQLWDSTPYAKLVEGRWVSNDDEDGDLHPLASFELGGTGCTAYVYQYAFVAIVNDDDPTDYFLTRMD